LLLERRQPHLVRVQPLCLLVPAHHS
jgi:hypothetical protein